MTHRPQPPLARPRSCRSTLSERLVSLVHRGVPANSFVSLVVRFQLSNGASVASAGSVGQFRSGGGGLEITALSGGITLQDATVTSVGDASLTALNGGISLQNTSSKVQANGVQLTSSTGVTNAGSVLASGELLIRSSAAGRAGPHELGPVAGRIRWTRPSAPSTTGPAARSSPTGCSCRRQAPLKNAGQIQATRISNISAGSLDNLAGGNILTSTVTGGSGGAITVSGDVFNEGTIASKTSLGLTSSGAITNSATGTLDSEGGSRRDGRPA